MQAMNGTTTAGTTTNTTVAAEPTDDQPWDESHLSKYFFHTDPIPRLSCTDPQALQLIAQEVGDGDVCSMAILCILHSHILIIIYSTLMLVVIKLNQNFC